LSLEGRELKAKSRILRRHGRMTAEEESRKPKPEQGEGRHRPRFLDYMVIKVKPLSANRILANHNIRLGRQQALRTLRLCLADVITMLRGNPNFLILLGDALARSFCGAQGLRLLDAGARPELRGLFGETALHWSALLGEDRLSARLIEGSDVDLKDEKYGSPPLGWAIQGWSRPPAGSHSRHREVVALLVAAGARVEHEWLESARIRADAAMLATLLLSLP
jgi:hypothetical protein